MVSTDLVRQVLFWFTIFSKAKVNGSQSAAVFVRQKQEVVGLHIPDDNVAAVTLCHSAQDLPDKLRSICTANEIDKQSSAYVAA